MNKKRNLILTMDWQDRFFYFFNDHKLIIIILVCFICVAVLGCVFVCTCRTVPDVRSRVASFRSSFSFRRREMNDPCVKCQLIDMGEMACYTGLCPGCGRVPPSLVVASAPMIYAMHYS